MLHAKFQDHRTSGSGEEDMSDAGACVYNKLTYEPSAQVS